MRRTHMHTRRNAAAKLHFKAEAPSTEELSVAYTQGEVTSQSLCSRYDRHFVGITRYIALSSMEKIYRVT